MRAFFRLEAVWGIVYVRPTKLREVVPSLVQTAMVLSGYSTHAIDAKNRLAIPAKFRSRIDAEGHDGRLVVTPGDPPDRLWLYTDRRFEQMAEGSGSTLFEEDEILQHDQLFFPMAEYLEIDAQGRILVPEWMVERANLGRDVVICGVRDHLEVRRRDAFEKELDSGWQGFPEIRRRARDAYKKRGRQTGPEAGSS